MTTTLPSRTHDVERRATNVAYAVEPSPPRILVELQRVARDMDRVVATLRALQAVTR